MGLMEVVLVDTKFQPLSVNRGGHLAMTLSFDADGDIAFLPLFAQPEV